MRSNSDNLASKLLDYLARPPGDPSSGEVAAATRNCVAAAVERLGPRRAPVAEPPEIAGSATRWAREGVALETVLGAYHDELRSGLAFIAAETEDDKVVAGAQLMLRVLEMVTVTTSTAYVDEHRVVAREHQTAAQTLVSALLGGHGVAELAKQTGIAVAPAYQVVALSIPAHPEERRPGAGVAAARRRLRRVQAALADPLGSRALSLLSVAGGTVLVPIEDRSARVGVPAVTADVLGLLSEAAEVPLTATAASGPTARIPELAARTHDLLDSVRADERPPGLYRVVEPEADDDCDTAQPGHPPYVNSTNDSEFGWSA
ncbi:transcriptional regulator [Nocardia altamirensis]|uniref:transcriptional regulator n=1 Tax=Nocardia altamirensis TaxID=472158 RepID=UPI00083FED2A|nr:transcriptional regulator [Nocardia altamirensis]